MAMDIKKSFTLDDFHLTLSRRRPLSYRNQSIDLGSKSMDWFLYDNGVRLERVKSTFFMWSLSNIATDLKLDSAVYSGKFRDTATM